ncbi:alpha/beta hydrolase [Nocardia sp. NPDC006630]|uniref:alpha/beta fold hydrolase n=1 Tax=Nocardia sp. NPDC006630 TaxID=3157181 RepID=UPI0033A40AB9
MAHNDIRTGAAALAGMAMTFETGAVRSSDGTTIGYRRIGVGPGLVLVHGAMMTGQLFEMLARMLADRFTVYIPDRRGRGLSGPFGPDYSIQTEIDDLAALLRETNAHNVFGLSSGAVISLHAARQLPQITKLALYEPPLATGGVSPTAWSGRYERDLDAGKTASAFVSVLKGTGDVRGMAVLPRAVLVPLMALFLRMDKGDTDHGPLRELVPTVRYDIEVVRAAETDLSVFSTLQCDTLLLGGSRSAGYLGVALRRLAAILPNARSVTLPGVGHTATFNDEKPQLVAAELREFC